MRIVRPESMQRTGVAMPYTVRHHAAYIPKDLIVRTMRGQRVPPHHSKEWIHYEPANKEQSK